MLRDSFSDTNVFQCLSVRKIAAAQNCLDVDLQGYRSVAFVINVGELSGMTSVSYWVARIEHADVSVSGGAGTYALCTASELLNYASVTPGASGIVVNFTSTDFGSATYIAGYRGTKRYVRLVLSNGASTNPQSFYLGVTAIRLPDVMPANEAL